MAGRLQNEDFKTLSELTGAGGATNQLLNDTKIYITNAALAAQLSSLITSGDVLTSASLLKLGISTDSTTTGTAAALPAATKGILRLTNASLVSISTITGQAAGQYFVLINRTGNSITINDNDAANGIRTGTGAAMTVANNASVVIAYDSTSARSQVIGGSGSSITTPVSIANGGTGQTTQTAAFNALSPQTTKGDLIAHNGTNDVRVAVGTTGQYLIADSAATEGVRWADPSLARKYILNGDAENGTVGWTTYADAAGSAPVDGTGGAPNVSWTRSGSSPLRGTGSYVISKDAANRQGQGASYDFTIEAADKAKVMQITFDYMVSSGTFVAGNPSDRTSAGDSDLTIWIYDVTNGVLIQPSTYRLFSNSSTIASQYVANFQTASNSTSYRIIFHCGSTSAAAYAIKFDNINVLPTTYVYGTPITDWSSYTPTFNGSPTVASVTFWSRRAGDSLQVMGAFQLTAVNASTTALTIPSGLSIDTAKVGSSRKFVLGECTRIYQTGTETSLTKHVAAYNTGFLNQIFIASTGVSQNLGQNAWNGLFVNNDWVTVEATIPIAGWSSSVQMSDSADTRVVAASYYRTTTQSYANSTFTTISFDGKLVDTHGAMSSGSFTAPAAGIYTLFCHVLWAASPGSQSIIQVSKNGSTSGIASNGRIYDSDTNLKNMSGSIMLDLKAGDVITIQAYQSSGGSINLTTAEMSIERISGPSAIAATETVVARYKSSAAQSFTSGSTSIIDFATKGFDSHSAVTTGASWKFTAPISGKYQVSAHTGIGAATDTGARQLFIYKNGSVYSQAIQEKQSTTSVAIYVQVCDIVDCNAGDTIDLRYSQNSGGTLSFTSISDRVWVSILRVGN